MDVARRDELVAWKSQRYQEIIRDGLPPMPGMVEFVNELASHYPLAIASGSLYVEIHHLLTKLGLREKFSVLATADDCQRCKPDPEVYLLALLPFASAAAVPGPTPPRRRVPCYRGCAPGRCGRTRSRL